MARRFGQIMVLLVLLAVVEVLLAVAVAHWLGVLWTVLAIVALSLLGSLLLRREGMRAWRRFRDVAAQPGARPGPEVVDGLLGLGGGLLLVVPGFISGAAGLLCLFPPTRRLFRGGAQRLAERRLSPMVVGDLFGPRRVRVRVRRGAPGAAGAAGTRPGSGTGGHPGQGATGGRRGTVTTHHPGGTAAGTPRPAAGATDVIEGEIVDG